MQKPEKLDVVISSRSVIEWEKLPKWLQELWELSPRLGRAAETEINNLKMDFRARDAEIKRECAERAVKCLCHFEHEWVERNGEMFPRHEDLLRAAIIGEEE